ncbi:MAG: hypothetical protein JNL84_00605 [Candidatus Accumulibacter sp.]|nr:hypothetical protein [Accumulibacter sp.]
MELIIGIYLLLAAYVGRRWIGRELARIAYAISLWKYMRTPWRVSWDKSTRKFHG